MADKRLLVCDSCGAETSLYESDGWMQARTYISTQDFHDHVMSMRYGGLDDGTNHGDFCGLGCLANWSSAQLNLRTLEEEAE